MRYQALDAWRGLAALGVVLFHAPFLGAAHTAAVIADFGFVQLFFVLSGFVIAHAYGHRIAGPIDAARFIVRRFGRLYPLHLFTFAVMLALELAKLTAMRVLHVGAGDPAFGPGAGWHSAATNVFLVHAVGFESDFTWNGPSWSISAEFWTYLVFAAVALLAGASRIAVVGTVAATAAVFYSWMVRHGAGTVAAGFSQCLWGFFVGCLVYRLSQRTPSLDRRLGTGLELAALVGMVPLLDANLPWRDHWTPLVFGAVIWVFAQERGLLSTLLRTRPLQALGALSYSIYLIHYPLMAIMLGGMRVVEAKTGLRILTERSIGGDIIYGMDFGVPLLADVATLAFIAVVVLVARWTYAFVEVPWRDRFNAWSDQLSSGVGYSTPNSRSTASTSA